MNTPLISIGITCFNAVETIKEAVDSAINQTWKHTEIIIVDDCSNQPTQKILKKISQQYPKIKIHHHSTNKGVAAARNSIINFAQGEFLVFFDDDDISLPNRIDLQYQRITNYENSYANGSIVICHTSRVQSYLIDNKRRIEKTMGTNLGIVPNGEDVALRILTGKTKPNIIGSIASCSQMARLSSYKTIGFFDEGYQRLEDTEFNIRAALKGAHFVGISDSLVCQKIEVSPEKKLELIRKYNFKLIEQYQDFINKHYSYQFFFDWLSLKYDFFDKRISQCLALVTKIIVNHPILTVKKIFWTLPNYKLILRTFILYSYERK